MSGVVFVHEVSPAELTKILSERITNFAEHQSVEEVTASC